MPIGLGFAPLGVSVLGYGSVDTAAAALKRTVYVDPNDGAQKDAIKVDGAKRQYVFDAQGRRVGMLGIQQLVELRVLTVRGSSVLGDVFGLARPGDVIDDGITVRVQDAIGLAVKDLVDNKQIEIVEITVDRTARSGIRIVFTWRDLTTGLEHPTTL